jgi:hypothetical protein
MDGWMEKWLEGRKEGKEGGERKKGGKEEVWRDASMYQVDFNCILQGSS